MPASSKVAWDSDLQKDVVLPNTKSKKFFKDAIRKKKNVKKSRALSAIQ